MAGRGAMGADAHRAAALRPARRDALRTARFLGLSLAVAAVIALFATAVLAAESAKKPPVPPGADPGGVLVALIGEGVDYIKPEIARRLARDGEGEIIGWDFVDGDRRPYRADVSAKGRFEALCVEFCTQTRIANVILNVASKARLVVLRTDIRASINGSHLDLAARAIGMAVQTGARVSLLDVQTGDQYFKLLSSAAKQFPEVLFVLSRTSDLDLPLKEWLSQPTGNIVVVRAFNLGCQTESPDIAITEQTYVDIAATVDCVPNGHHRNSWIESEPSEIAAAQVIGLAARIAATEPKLTGAELKARIIALAKPFPEGVKKVARYGWIEDPSAQYVGK